MMWGELIDCAQRMLGISPPLRYGCKNILDPKKFPVEDLREYFEERKLDDGNLGFEIYMDRDYYSTCIGVIETSLPFDTEVTDEMFLNILEDYATYVRSLPLVNPENRPGSSAEQFKKDMLEMNKFMFEGYAEFAPELLRLILLGDLQKRLDAETAFCYRLPRLKNDDIEF